MAVNGQILGTNMDTINYEGKEFKISSPQPPLMMDGVKEAIYEDDQIRLSGFFKRTPWGWVCLNMGHYLKRDIEDASKKTY